MSRHTTFKFCLDPTVEQREVLARHAGASRFAFDGFNAWKNTEGAGRVLAVDADGVAEVVVTGLAWRDEVCQQVFEETAVDLGKGLKAWSESRAGKRKGGWVGIDRGLSAFVVAANAEGTELARVQDAPQALAAGMKRQRRLGKSLSREKKDDM
jgi:hypothetical protein